MKSHLIAEHRHDPYKARGKVAEGTVCSECMAAFVDGRWQWVDGRFEAAHWDLCPACRRIRDNYPAGELTLRGAFLQAHKQEILNLSRNVEEAEKREHPLQRIMHVDEQAADQIVITTTDIHLARHIAHAITDAFKGELDVDYDEAGYFVRMSWKREN